MKDLLTMLEGLLSHVCGCVKRMVDRGWSTDGRQMSTEDGRAYAWPACSRGSVQSTTRRVMATSSPVRTKDRQPVPHPLVRCPPVADLMRDVLHWLALSESRNPSAKHYLQLLV